MLHHSKFSLFALLALLCAAVSGCTPTKYISSDPTASEEITRGSETDDAVIRLKDGSIAYNAYHVAVRADSTEWYSKDRALREAVSTSVIQSISIHTPDFSGDAVEGLEIGAIPGLLLGLIAGKLETISPGPEQLSPIAGFAITFGSAMALSGIFGGVAGSLHRTVYKP